MKKKDFMGPISIEEVCLGSSAPTFSNFRFSGEVMPIHFLFLFMMFMFCFCSFFFALY